MFKFVLGMAFGAAISTAVAQEVIARCDQGTLVGYIVQDDSGEVCRDPWVYNNFRGQGNFILCSEE